MGWHEKHMQYVEAVNKARTEHEHHDAQLRLDGFREGVAEVLGLTQGELGRILMDADSHYLERGVDRPMCGGVWSDWKATGDAA